LLTVATLPRYHLRITKAFASFCFLCHASLIQLIWKMAVLVIVGHKLEATYGSRDFLAFYLTASIVSMLGRLFFESVPRGFAFVEIIGAAGPVMATAMLYAFSFPNLGLHFFSPHLPIWMRSVSREPG
jgi:membrane associated rhomboid family serine protease